MNNTKKKEYYLLLLGEDIAFGFLSALLANPAEVSIVDGVGDFNVANIQFRACGNHKMLVHTTNGYAVDFVGSCTNDHLAICLIEQNWIQITSDQEESRFQGLEKHNTLSSMDTSQENKDGTRLKGLAYLRGSNLLGNFGSRVCTEEER